MKKVRLISILLAVLFISGVSSGAIELAGEGFIPEPNQEITVQIQTDIPLFCMGLIITVTGDANITGAVNTADCNIYGWDPDWPTDPYIDPEGWVYVSGVKWEGEANGVVGYLKFIYNSGEVSVSITEGEAFDPNCEAVPISDMTLVFGEPDPNDSGKEGVSSSQDMITDENIPAAEITNDVDLPLSSSWQNKQAERQKHLMHCPAGLDSSDERSDKAAYKTWEKYLRNGQRSTSESTAEDGGRQTLMELDEPNIIEINSNITTNQVWTANNLYRVTAYIHVQALLVIEPGTIICFSYGPEMLGGGSIYVDNGGTLISCGTPDRPIAYTSNCAEPYYGDYFCPICITSTASPATKVTYSYVEYAKAGIITENIRLDSPIENNVLFHNECGVGQYGPQHTDIRNNLIFDCYNDFYPCSGIEIYMESWEGAADGNSYILIQNNTCDWGDYGITIHGTEDEDNAGLAVLANNIVSESYLYGLNFIDDHLWGLVSNTGYYDNEANNKNWEFEEYDPVEANEYPYVSGHLDQSCPFIDAGLEYVEETPLVGTTTDINSMPDSNVMDLGFHYPNWNYSNAGQGDYYAGDLDRNLIVDFRDFAILANGWRQEYDANDLVEMFGNWLMMGGPDPNIQIDIYGDGSDGYVEVGISNYTLGTCQAFLLVDGVYADNLFGFEDGEHALVNVAGLSDGLHQFKIVSINDDGRITCSHIKEADFNSPLNYCTCNYAYEVNKPLYFCAYVADSNEDVSVKAIDDENNVLWMQTYSGGSVNSFIPAGITGNYDIDQIILDGASGFSVSLSVTPIFDPDCISPNVRALIVSPDLVISLVNGPIRAIVKNAFKAHGVEYWELENTQATSFNLAWFAQNRNIQYLYFNGHGDYNDVKGTLRTNITLWDTRCFSFKQSDFDPNNIPSWCKKLKSPLDFIGWSIKAMGFHTLKFVHFDCCYSGRLMFMGNELVQGPDDETGLTVNVANDMVLALGVNDSSLLYLGWYHKSSADPISTFTKFTRDEWVKLREGYKFYNSIKYAFDESEWDRVTGRYPWEDLRLLGRDLYFYLYGIE